MTFGQALRHHRKAAGMSMRQVAEHLGCSIVYISNIERDRQPQFRWEWIQKAEALLGVEHGALLRAADRRKAPVLSTDDMALLDSLAPNQPLRLLLFRLMGGPP